MSVLNQSGEEQVECPLCMEPLEVDDLHFYPCTCGYQICRFCWNRIREGENGLCPACRKAYPENPADFTPLSQEQVAAIRTEKKAREQKKRNKTLESRRALANVRVVQNNLVFVVGLPVRLADPEILKRQEYFGKYGKIHKVVINQSTSYAGSQGPSASAYVTYVSPCDALRAIQGVNNVTLDGRVLKGSLGTTKYCANFMKNQPCPKPDCMYLHELGDPKASFTKEEMHAGLHQVYERKLHQQLLARDQHNAGIASSTNAEKGSSNKDGNQSNFIPTTVVTSSHINIVNSSKCKSSSGSSSSSSTSSSGKEAWPSLGSSPPADSPAPVTPTAAPVASPKPILANTVNSQENGTSSESSSPTQQLQSSQPTTQTQAQSKNKEQTDAKPNRNSKDNSTNTQNGTSNGKKSKNDKKQKSNNNEISDTDNIDNNLFRETPEKSVFENTEQNYLTNELVELESDRHSLLENHDLLDNSDHSLLDDDSGHSLLNEINNEVMMMQRHREIMPGLDNNHLMTHKSPLVNGYGLLDRDSMSYLGNDRPISNISQGLMDQKEMLLRERSRSEMIMRQNEMLGRQHSVMVEPKHYMPTSSIGLESASELLGANYHPNANILPPFGMRVDNSMGGGMGASSINNLGHVMGNGLGSLGNSLGNNHGNSLGNNHGNNLGNGGMNTMNGMTNNALAGFMMHNPQLIQQQQIQQSAMVNGFDAQQTASEGRYLAENMDKFFTDFHKAQQLRQQAARPPLPRNVLSAERLEHHHKQRMCSLREVNSGGRASGDCDDDLDFDPFKETQKALAEMIETEMMHNTGSRLPPPGFSHLQNTFGGMPRHPQQHQGYSSGGSVADWSRLDPAIVCGGARAWLPPLPSLGSLPLPAPRAPHAPHVPLPPGFAPNKQTNRTHECVDAK